MQKETQTPEITLAVTPLVQEKLLYSEVLAQLEHNPTNTELVALKDAYEVKFQEILKTAKGDKVEKQFSQIAHLITSAKSLDLIVEDVIYFLTDCDSSTIRDYKQYLISLNRSFEEVKTLNLMNKKQVFKMLVDDVASEIRQHLEGANFFDKGAITALLQPIAIICDNYEWIVDLYFNDSIDQPKHRLELVKQIARVQKVDNHSKELKIYKMDTFKDNGVKVAVFSNNEIKALNTQKSIRGGGTYFTFSASSLAQHIKDTLDAEAKAIKEFEEKEKQAQTIQNAIEAKKRMRAEIEKELGLAIPATVSTEA